MPWLKEFLGISYKMRELGKDFFKGFFYVLESFPILTGIIFLIITIHLFKNALPKAYNSNKEKSLYSYWNYLGIIIAMSLFSLMIFIMQLFRVLNKLNLF